MEKVYSRFFFFLTALILSVGIAQAQAVGQEKRELLLVRSPDAVGCFRPKQDSECTKRLVWGDGFRATEEQTRDRVWEDSEWISVGGYWIQTKYLVPQSELRPISSGWQFRYLVFVSGDYDHYFQFSENGNVDVRVGPKKAKGHVFIGPAVPPYVVEIRFPTPIFSNVAENAGYDPRTRSLRPTAVPGELFIQVRFSDPPRPALNWDGKCLFDCDVKVDVKGVLETLQSVGTETELTERVGEPYEVFNFEPGSPNDREPFNWLRRELLTRWNSIVTSSPELLETLSEGTRVLQYGYIGPSMMEGGLHAYVDEKGKIIGWSFPKSWQKLGLLTPPR